MFESYTTYELSMFFVSIAILVTLAIIIVIHLSIAIKLQQIYETIQRQQHKESSEKEKET